MENLARVPESNSRQLAKLLRELLDQAPHATLADVVDDLKTRAARLRIPCSPDDISGAFWLVGSNTKLLAAEAPKPAPPAPETQGPIVSRELAADVLKIARERYKAEHPDPPAPRGDRLVRSWTLTRQAHACGRCHGAIRVGTVALTLRLQNSGRTLWRCQACGGDPPAGVIIVEEAAAIAVVRASFFERLKHLIRPTLDVKTRQAGE